jgi:hypothetical protein
MATKRHEKARKIKQVFRVPIFCVFSCLFVAKTSVQLIAAKADFQAALLNWYRGNARTLPWRESPSFYKTVVSEFMLQQTQVKTVLPYFARE